MRKRFGTGGSPSQPPKQGTDALLTDAFVASALALPPVTGAPALVKAQCRPDAAPAWWPVAGATVPPDFVWPARSLASMYNVDDYPLAGVVIDATGRCGLLAKTEKTTFVSDDERGERGGGGVVYLAPFGDQSDAATPAAQAALASLLDARAAAPGQEKAWRDGEVARRQAVRAWWAWWQALALDHKVRVAATAEDGGLCSVARNRSGRWVVSGRAVGQGRKTRYLGSSLPFTAEDTTVGRKAADLIGQWCMEALPGQFDLADVLKASRIVDPRGGGVDTSSYMVVA